MPRCRLLSLACLLVAVAAMPAVASAAAAPVTRLEVRIVTGTDPAAPGAIVELRIRETGRPDRRIPLARGDAWPIGSTRVLPVALPEPLDPDAVTRWGLHFRGTGGGPPDAWEVVSAEVYAVRGRERVRLLDASVRGLLRSGGEIATPDRAANALVCARDAECDDGRACNGRERCLPGTRGADARGCAPGAPMMCPTNQICVEGEGCRGVDGPAPGEDPAPAAAAAESAGGAGSAGAPAAPRAPAGRADPPVQSCSGNDVLLTEADGAQRRAACPTGTRCVAQPNGTGVCAPAAR